MLTYFNYFRNRYLGQKGQGMVEYAVIVAVVIAVGVALVSDTTSTSITTTIKDLYSTVFAKTKDIK